MFSLDYSLTIAFQWLPHVFLSRDKGFKSKTSNFILTHPRQVVLTVKIAPDSVPPELKYACIQKSENWKDALHLYWVSSAQ